MMLAACLGMLTWSLLEYLIHRFLGHEPKTRPNVFATEHVRHHGEGNYFAPWWKKLLAALAFTALVTPPALAVAGIARGLAYVAGLIGLYVAYEVLHRLLHVWGGVGWYGRWARRHHFAHHYCDTRFNHGVTSPLWDLVFRTYRPVKTIRVPARFASGWMREARFERVFIVA